MNRDAFYFLRQLLFLILNYMNREDVPSQ